MSDLDYEHISNLFAIVKGNAEHSGKFGAIQDYAMRELNAINDQLREKRMGEKKAEEAQLAEHNERQAKLKAEGKPKAIPSEQLDLSGKPVEEPSGGDLGGQSGNESTLVDRRL